MRAPIRLIATLILVTCLLPCRWAVGQPVDPAALVEQLADPTQREGASRKLLEMGKDALGPLEASLRSKRSSEFLRREILKLLPSFGPEGVEVVKASLGDASLEFEAARQLSELGSDPGIATVMFARMEKSLNPRVRIIALDWLAAHGDAATVNEKLYSYLSDASDRVRSRAAELIAQRTGVNAVRNLMEMLRQAEFNRSSTNRGLRTALVEALGIIGTQGPDAAARVVPTILRALGEEDEQEVAVQALIRIGAPSVSSLLMILKAGDTRRAAAAMDALLAIGQKAAPEVVSLLQARHPKMKLMAQQFLGFYQDPAVFPLLRDLYGRSGPEDKVVILRIAALYKSREPQEFVVQATLDEDPLVRSTAVKLLAATGERSVVPVLLTRAEEDSDQDIRMAAVRGLFGMGDSSPVVSFGRMLEYEKWPVRLELLEALAFMGTPSIVKSIAEQLRHRRSEVANAAARALANITYMTGERSPDDWVRDVRSTLGEEEGENVDVQQRSVVAGDESVEVSLLGNSREVILFLAPQVELQARNLQRYLGRLAEDYTVAAVAFDGCPQQGGERLAAERCFQRQADRLEMVRQEVARDPVVVLTHGVTGFAGMAYASSYPDSVRSLVVANPVFPRRVEVERTLATTLEKLPVRWKKELELLERNSGNFLPRARNAYRSRIELASQVRGEGRAMLVAQGYYGLSWFLDETFFAYEDTTIESALANLRVPVLLVFGAEDFSKDNNVERFRRIGKIRRNLVSTTVNGSIRFSMVEQSDTFQLAVLHFLQSYRVGEGRPSGVGGGWPAAAVAYGEQGQFDGGDSGRAAVAGTTPREGELVESSRLTRFLSQNAPDRVVEGEVVDEAAREAEMLRLAEARKAEEARQAEEKRQAEEARLAEERRLAEEQRQAEEAARQAEEARLAEERRKLEEEKRRLAEEKAKVEGTAQPTPGAVVVAPPVVLPVTPTAPVVDPTPKVTELQGAVVTTTPLTDTPTPAVVETKPVEPTPAVVETKPVEPTPAVVETKPVEPTPAVVETKPVEPTPAVVEAKPVEPTPAVVETKPVEPPPAETPPPVLAVQPPIPTPGYPADDRRVAPPVESAPEKGTEPPRLAETSPADGSKAGTSPVGTEPPPSVQVAAEGAKAGTSPVVGEAPSPLPATGPAGPSGPTTTGVSAGSVIDTFTYLGWGLIGGGVLLAGGGGYMTWVANDHADKANALDPYDPDYNSKFDTHLGGAQTWQAMSIVSYAVGAASILVGIDMLLDWPISLRPRESRYAWSLQPVAMPDGGLVLFNWNLP